MALDLEKLKLTITTLDAHQMEVLFDHVANGGSVTQWCVARGLRYSDLMKAIRSKKELKAAFDQAMEDRKEWAKERLLTEVMDLGTYTLADIFNEDGSRKPVHMLPPGLIASIKELTADGDIKFQDKLKAIAMYSSELGLFTEKKELLGTLSLAQIIAGAKEKESQSK